MIELSKVEYLPWYHQSLSKGLRESGIVYASFRVELDTLMYLT